MKTASLLFALMLAGAPLAAQSAEPPAASIPAPAAHGPCEEYAPSDIITPHITDSRCIELPTTWRFWEPHEIALPRWKPIVIGGIEFDMSPTKHVVMMLFGSFLCTLLLLSAAAAHKRHEKEIGRPKGFANGIEAMVLWIRQEVALPNLGPHGEAYVPFILSLFWFILFANVLGLIPYGSTSTGNIAVTATLALITFVTVEIAGVVTNGWGYLSTIFYWNKDLPIGIRIPMAVLMTPIEIVGKITKPFALAVRLLANMMAGHIVVLAMISLVFTFHSAILAPFPLVMATAITFLELGISFLQAFIFAMLASIYIGLIRAHH